MGEDRPAHEATSEAVALWRALAADNPAHQPNLAAALTNLGNRLAALGEDRPAHEATSEAITLWRALAADNPAHQPNLAAALDNLGNNLCDLGEHDNEFRRRLEALKLYEMSAERDADLHGADYERAVAKLQTEYVRHGQEEQAAGLGLPPQRRDTSERKGPPERRARQDGSRP
ncbi:hypothetical protein [Actinoplanes subtropicus]|uniref:hypothetical protein n=1 Tax=Actinoplanes subtropicus TaxID=543632 RepID=UPI000AD5E9C1|nr:hypothetical protein [Actinoplanes subtropicus]